MNWLSRVWTSVKGWAVSKYEAILPGLIEKIKPFIKDAIKKAVMEPRPHPQDKDKPVSPGDIYHPKDNV